MLVIMGDDHAAYVCGAYGNERARTPNLDRLAATGVRFDRAYCNSPVCTASRQSLLTGRLPRTIGVTQLSTPLPEEEATLAELLASAGYRTAAIGKMHFNSNLAHGFETRIDLPEYRAHLAAHPPEPLPGDVAVLGPWRPFRDPARIWLNGSYLPYPAHQADMAGTYFAEQAARLLGEYAEGRQPFYLVVSFYEPHAPFHFPLEDAGTYDPASFDVPAVGPDDDWQIPEIFRDLSDDEKRRIIASYYTSAAFLDRNVGRVLEALEENGLAKRTLVVYMSDHGYMLGQHGRFEKHCFYEPAVRAPLVVRYPGRWGTSALPPGPAWRDGTCGGSPPTPTLPHEGGGRSTDALVEFIDLAPTILEVCGLGVPENMQGRSLVPLLDGRTDRQRDWVFSEYSENEEAMIRTERFKYIYTTGARLREDGYATGRPLPGPTHILFDLEADPEEMHNVAGDPRYADVLAEMQRLLYEHLVATERLPEQIPPEGDAWERINWCLRPHDVAPAHSAPQADPEN